MIQSLYPALKRRAKLRTDGRVEDLGMEEYFVEDIGMFRTFDMERFSRRYATVRRHRRSRR